MKLDTTVVVVPFLNEEQSLCATARSLGFGLEEDTKSYLVLVDNASTDASMSIADEIRVHSAPGKVICVTEPQRGYVPARDSGNCATNRLIGNAGYCPECVLILQADADTIYSRDYIQVAADVAASTSAPAFFECETTYPSNFRASHLKYIKYCEELDAEYSEILAEDAPRVITDDKAVGYRLSDYFLWGRHRREWLRTGEEIHAESSRLLMRAMTYGCKLCPIEGAVAEHSVRRIIEAPVRDFVTGGFPRGITWRTDLYQQHKIESDFSQFVDLRRRHLIAFFGLLPAHVGRCLAGEASGSYCEDLSNLPHRTIAELQTKPALLVEDVLDYYGLLQ